MPLTVPEGTTIHPEEDMVLCQMYEESELIYGSTLVKPETAREEVFFCKVLKLGPGRTIDIEFDTAGKPIITRKPIPWKEGQDVLFKRYQGERIMVGNVLLILLRQDDVIATIDIDPEKRKELFRLAGTEMYERLEGARANGTG